MIQFGKTYTKVKYGIKTVVIPVKVKGDEITLRHPDRKDTFKIHLNEFNKFYQLDKHQATRSEDNV